MVEEVSQREKRLTMSVLMTPDKANVSGNIQDGDLHPDNIPHDKNIQAKVPAHPRLAAGQ